MQYWRKVVTVRGNHYILPRGSIGREIIDRLAKEMLCLSRQSAPSERVIVFIAVMMQRDKMVKKGADIRRLLKRRIDEWRQERSPELIHEYERCAKQWSKSHGVNLDRSKDHVLRVFSNLMLRGDIRSAVRWLTDQACSGGVLDPSQLVNGKPVAQILQEKHPEASQSGTRAFLPCDELPPLVDVDITGSHIENAARSIRGSCGPGGSTAAQWQCYLLRFGSSSSSLRDAVAELVRCLANGVVEWAQIKALMSCRLIALDKCPGV